jgi:hypothetical protein
MDPRLRQTMLKREAEEAERAKLYAKSEQAKVDIKRPCLCGCVDFWLPVGHKDHPEFYKCCTCEPAPSNVLIQNKITVGFKPPEFSITFNHDSPACSRCSSRTVTLTQNGYQCGMCCTPILDSESAKFWKSGPINPKFKGEIVRFTRPKVQALIDKKSHPIVRTCNSGELPVDAVGFVGPFKRWDLDYPPDQADIEIATKILKASIPAATNGQQKSVSLAEIRNRFESNEEYGFCTDGAMIVAAGKLGWKITQNDLDGLVNVSRKWWNSFAGV